MPPGRGFIIYTAAASSILYFEQQPGKYIHIGVHAPRVRSTYVAFRCGELPGLGANTPQDVVFKSFSSTFRYVIERWGGWGGIIPYVFGILRLLNCRYTEFIVVVLDRSIIYDTFTDPRILGSLHRSSSRFSPSWSREIRRPVQFYSFGGSSLTSPNIFFPISFLYW